MSGVYRRGTQGTCDRSSEGRAGAAQVSSEESARHCAQQVWRSGFQAIIRLFSLEDCRQLKVRNISDVKVLFCASSGRLPQLTAAIELVNEISKQLTGRKNDAVTEISNTFDELEKALHQRKTALITEVENICSSKQKVRKHKNVFHIFAQVIP